MQTQVIVLISLNLMAFIAVAFFLRKIMTTQAEAAQQLTDLNTQVSTLSGQVTKIGGEVTGLQTRIGELEDAATNQGDVSVELQTAIDNLKASATSLASVVQGVDEQTPDTPPAA